MLASAPFHIDLPTRIYFGWSARHTFPDVAGVRSGDRILVIGTDSMLTRTPISDFLANLGHLGCTVYTYSQVQPNPRTTDVDRCFESFGSMAIDHVIGIGGGSTLDQAKAISMSLSTGQKTSYLLKLGGPLPPRENVLSLFPTTSGTGSEASWGAILTDPITDVKIGLRGRALAADFAIIDPELTVTVPAQVTAITGFDVLTHSLETYLSKLASPYTEGLSRQAMERVFEYLPRALSELTDQTARTELAYASTLMGINLALSSTCLPHRLQYPLGAATDSSHAEGLSALYPAWLRAVLPYAEAKLANCAAWIGVARGSSLREDAEAFVQRLLEFIEQIGMKRSLSDLGARRDMALDFVDRVTGKLDLDPGDTSVAAIKAIYLSSL